MDARIVKTKTALISSFKTLLTEKKFENVTVNEICEHAKIRRATFYKHFEDKYDFLRFYIHYLREKFDSTGRYGAPDGTAGYYIEYAQEMIEFLDENEKMITNILESETFGNILTVILHENLRVTKERLENSIAKGLKLPASAETVANMLVGGVATVVLNWFSGGKKISKEKLLEEIASLISILERR